MSNATEIIPGVFVGNQFTAADKAFFINNNIRRVVNCTPDLPFYFESAGVQYYRIPLNDLSDDVNNGIMKNHLLPVIHFIYGGRPSRESGVLIHCHAGVSRSCTVAVALLRVCCAESISQAIGLLIAKRRIAFFNGARLNFRNALYWTFGS